MKVKPEHTDVLATLHKNGMLSRQAMKSIRGQIISMESDEQREEYLKKLIRRCGRKARQCTSG